MTLLSVFLLWDGRVPSEEEAKGIAASLYDVSALVGTAGVVAMLTFVAYLIGSVVTDAAGFAHDRLAALQLRLDYIGVRSSPLRRSRRTPSAILVRSEGSIVTNASSIGSRGIRSLCDVADRAWLDAVNQFGPDVSAAIRLAIDALGEDTPDGRWVTETALGSRPTADVSGAKRAIAIGFARRTLEEIDLVHTRLLGTEPELHGAVDRLRSEAELRLALLAPLLLLAVALAVRDVAVEHASWPVLLVMAAVPIFYLQAARRRRASGDLLSDALAIQRVQGPTLERFERLVKDAQQRPVEERLHSHEDVDDNVRARRVTDAPDELNADPTGKGLAQGGRPSPGVDG